MKKTIILLFFILGTLFIQAQTLLDNYDASGTLTYNTEGSWVESAGNYEGRTGGITGPEHSYASYDLSASLSGYDLNKTNSCKWFGWMDLNRSSASGWGTAQYACGMVLAANNADFNATSTSGYAVGLNSSGALVVFRFSAGIVDGVTALPGTATSIVSSGYSYANADDGVNFFVELLSDGKWKVYYKAGAKLSDADAIDVTKYNGGNATSASADITYSGTNYKYSGWIYAHSSGATDKAFFDNYGASFSPAGSSNSNIIASGSALSNLDYISKTSSTITTTSDAYKVWSFTIQDGGGSADADALTTVLNSIVIDKGSSNNTGSWANIINRAALFDGSTKVADVAVTADSIVYTGLSGANVTAPDDGSKKLDLYITFKTTNIVDKQQFQFRIKKVSVTATGSQFAAFSDISSSITNDTNRINVIASKLRFVTQPSNTTFNVGMSKVTLEAVDANNFRDSDFVSSVRITSTGIISPTFIDSIAAKGLASFTGITHAQPALSLTLNAVRTSTLDWSVNSNTFNITGSSNSDIINDNTFSYSSDINYVLYQKADSITNTSQSIGAYRFTIRDGGASTDADTLSTTLTSITFSSVSGIANIRCAALFDGNSKVNASPIINNTGGTIAFSGLNYIVSDNSSRNLTLRLTFESSADSVTDNQQMSFTITSANASASVSGSQFTAFSSITSSIVGNNNRIEASANKIRFKTQPTGTSTGNNLAAFTIQAQDTFGVLDLDNVNSFNIYTTGTSMTASNPYTLSAGSLNVSNIQFSSAQSNIKLYIVASGFTYDNDDTSSAFSITSFANNSYRTKTAGTWPNSGTATWQRFTGGTWNDASAPAAGATDSIYILHAITTNAAWGSGTSNYIIQNGGSYTIGHNGTIGYCRVDTGGALNINVASVTYSSSASKNFILMNGATMTLNTSALDNADNFWNGNEDFYPRSTVVIANWNFGGSGGIQRLIANPSQVSTNSSGNGYLFGNITITASPGSIFGLIDGSQTIKLCEGNLNSNTSGGSNVTFTTSTANVEIGGDLIINANTFSAAAVNSGNPVATINGKLRINNSALLNLNQNSSGSATSFINLKGNLEVYNTATINSSDAGCGINFTGTNTQQIDIASTATDIIRNCSLIVKSNATAQIANQNMKIGDVVDVLVDSLGTFDFGFSGSTPLNVTESGGTTSFTVKQFGTIKITSADGIDKDGAQNIGNVRTDVRTFNTAGRYYYKGKYPSQRLGDGLPASSGTKYITIDLDSIATNILFEGYNGTTYISTSNIIIASGGQLSINQGTISSTGAADFTGAGNLIMTGGLYKTNVDSATSTVPQLSGSYTLTEGTFECNGNNNIQRIRGSRTYYNLKISGSNTYGSNYKTPTTTLTVNNNLYITGTAILETTNTLSGTGGLTMDGGRFKINKVSGTLPELTATASGQSYNLTGGTIEITGTSSSQDQTFRARDGQGQTISYYHLDFNALGANTTLGNINPNNNFNVNGTLNIYSPCILRLDATDIIGGVGEINISAGAGLLYAHSNGIDTTGTSGQLTLTGTRTFSKNSSYGFIGTGNMVTGNALPDSVSSLYITKTYGSNTINFNKKVIIKDSVAYRKGIVIGSQQPVLTFINGASATSMSDSSYISGQAKKIGNSGFTFPIGKIGTGYQPIQISAPDHISDAFTAEYMRSSPRDLGGELPYGIKQITTCEYWNLNEIIDAGASTSINITMYYNLNSGCKTALDSSYISDQTKLRILHHNGTDWENKGNHAVSGDSKNGSITVYGINSFSPFAFGSTEAPPVNPLPVTWLNTEVKRVGKSNFLKWEVTNEVGLSHYMIYRSDDMEHWESINQIYPEISNTSSRKIYTYQDEMLDLQKKIFYKVQSIDWDGKTDYSAIMVLEESSLSSQTQVICASNPSFGHSFQIEINSLKEPAVLQLISSNGQIIQTNYLVSDNQQIIYNELSSGVYFVKLITKVQVISKMILIQ